MNLAEDAPLPGIQAHKTNIKPGDVHVGINEGSDSYGAPDFSETLEVYKNTNFEELQNLFDITQKLVHKQGEILNVRMIE